MTSTYETIHSPIIKTTSPIGHLVSPELRLRSIKIHLPVMVKIVMKTFIMNKRIDLCFGSFINSRAFPGGFSQKYFFQNGLEQQPWYSDDLLIFLISSVSGDRIRVAITVSIRLNISIVKRCLSVLRCRPNTGAMSTTAANWEKMSRPETSITLLQRHPVSKKLD